MTTPKAECCIVMFGAFGDLARRKLFPSIYHLRRQRLIPDSVRVLATGRREVSEEAFRRELRSELIRYVGEVDCDEEMLDLCLDRTDYRRLDVNQTAQYGVVSQWLAEQAGKVPVFYLAISALLYEAICRGLAGAGAVCGKCRVVVEKPIGFDLASSQSINDMLSRYFEERQIYRIDHYLGKETVQNLLALRFANALFASQWNHQGISHVEITVAETVGIEGRWDYFDQAGQLRDMVQSHVLQLLSLIAMDPPNDLGADAIRDEKVKVLKALRPLPATELEQHLVWGQYRDGVVNGKEVPGYLEEEGANPDSRTGTFFAIKAHIDNWRWSGVPFYLRTGKRLPQKVTQITVYFKPTPHHIFAASQRPIAENRLMIRIQPDEGISLQIMTKDPSLSNATRLRPGLLEIEHFESGQRVRSAYERLLWEVMQGEQYLFVRRDEVEHAWLWCDQLRECCEQEPQQFRSYAAGSWGPKEAALLMAQDGRSWLNEF
jgi:glucose-6-phosphate 1-dehydrogenase